MIYEDAGSIRQRWTVRLHRSSRRRQRGLLRVVCVRASVVAAFHQTPWTARAESPEAILSDVITADDMQDPNQPSGSG